jgi:tetratricopeptide (TPR) repeat protein
MAAPKRPAGLTKTAARSEQQSTQQIAGIESDVVDYLWAQSDENWHRGDYPRIVALDRIIVEIDPQFIEPYVTGAWLQESMGDLKNAEMFYEYGVRNNPRNEEANFDLGFFYLKTLKNYPRAIETFKRETSYGDAGVNDWKMLAHSYEANNQLFDSLATWKVIESRWPTAPAVELNVHRLESLLSKNSSPRGGG